MARKVHLKDTVKFGPTCKGDTPETNQQSALAVQWIDEFVALLNAATVAA